MIRLHSLALGLAAAVLLLVSGTDASAQKKKSRLENVGARFNAEYNYEVETVGVGTEGTKALKVWAYGKSVEEAIVMAKKCAVAACIYRGLPASTYALATPALCPHPEDKWDDYFEEFFKDGGQYLNYVNLTSDGVPSGQDRLKIKGGGFKVGIYVQVLFDRLRKDLEEKGVIKSMDSWF
ncbi:MAG: hypothetical protein J5669_03350 [Bacteroidales bacterium]|nr:hypothetical protein [Bacteroidales bacterium]